MASPDFRRGVRLGIDWGKARVGVAACDADGLLAYPLETIDAHDEAAVFTRLAGLVDEHAVVEVVLGMPVTLAGTPGLAADQVSAVGGRLASALPVPVRLVDERLTTAVANRQLAALDGRRRRKVVDQVAAAGILEGALEVERTTGHPPGALIRDVFTEGQ